MITIDFFVRLVFDLVFHFGGVFRFVSITTVVFPFSADKTMMLAFFLSSQKASKSARVKLSFGGLLLLSIMNISSGSFVNTCLDIL